MAEPSSAIMFRLPIPLRREVEQAARENQRSLGREVLFRLQRSFADEHKNKNRRRRVRKSAGTSEARS
jgi:Arc-like DNA binding dprotein